MLKREAGSYIEWMDLGRHKSLQPEHRGPNAEKLLEVLLGD